MPSKRKKNKRRMRRVQVQRRELEEQHAANPPIKSSTGVVVAAPPATTPKKASKSTAPPPEQIPLVIPVTAPTKVEPKPVEIEPVAELQSEDNHAADADVELLEQISAGAKDVELEAQTFAPEAVPAPEPLPADETDAVHKAEPVLETEPATEVVPPAEVPVGAPAELEIQPEEKAEPEPTHPVFHLESEVKADRHPEEDSAAAEEDGGALTPVQEAAAEPEEPEVQPAADDRVPEPAAGPDAEAAAEEAAPREREEQEEQEEHAAAIPAAPLSPAQDSLLEIEEIPLVSEKTSEGEEAPVSKTEKAADGLLSSDVHTETNLTVEDAAFQQEIVTDGDTLDAQTESVVLPDLDPADGTSSVSCADSAAEQKHAAAQSDSPKAEGCDLPCQMQLPVESAPLGVEEISVETALNGHIVPEVSIEG